MYLVWVSLLWVAIGTTVLADARKADPRLTPAWTIAFERGNDIWTAQGDGSGQKRVIRNGSSPCWSPDKSQLSFARNDDVWIAQSDGTHQRQLTHHRKGVRRTIPSDQGISITWNRKYGLITFSHPEDYTMVMPGSGRRVGVNGASIYDVWPNPPRARWEGAYQDVDDTGVFTHDASARLTAPGSGSAYQFSRYEAPAWSRSGEYLAFACNGDIWMMQNLSREDVPPTKPRGSGGPIRTPELLFWECVRFACVAGYDAANWHASKAIMGVSRISWSPSGRYLAYSLVRQGGTGLYELHLLRVQQRKTGCAAGADTVLDGYGDDPCFSPDGKLIAYCSHDPDAFGIWETTLDGKTQTRLISNAAHPAW